MKMLFFKPFVMFFSFSANSDNLMHGFAGLFIVIIGVISGVAAMMDIGTQCLLVIIRTDKRHC